MLSVLLIDDDKILLDMLEKILTRFEYDVKAADTGEDALLLFENNDFNLVITDIIMPEMDGNFIANYIRNSHKSYTPVIGMTGTPDYAEQENFDLVLSKPFSIDILLENVRKYIRNANLIS